MADNTTLNSGTGGDVIASDDIGGVKHQRVKLSVGADGSANDAIPVSNGLDTTAAGVPAVGIVGQFDDAAVGTVTENQFAPVRISSRRALLVEGVASGTVIPVSDGGGALTVDGTVAVTQSGTWDEVGINDSGNSITVDNGGTFVVQVDGSALTALQLIDDVVYVDDADWTDDTSKHALVGGVYQSTPHTVTDGDVTPFLTDVNGRLAIADGGGTITVDGTVAVTNAGLTALNGAIAGTEVQVDVLTMPTVTVNSHAVTNAGTFAVQVDGNALTALQLIDDVVATLGTTTYTETTTKGNVIAAVRRDADTTLVDTTNELGPLQMDANGRLKVEAFSGETLPVSLASVPSHAVTNAGTFAVQVDGNALTALQLIDDTIFTDDAAFTPATSKVSVIGLQADESSTDSVDEGDAGAPRMTLDRKIIVTPQPHTAGGLSIFRSLDLDETEEDVKTSAGCIYAVWATNTATSTRWLKFYNATAANVTVGTTTPVITIGLPGNSSDDISANFGPGGMGIAFDTAICAAATTGVADNDTGAPGANEVIINIFYK